jgi:4,5-DOPA dioxygenase extradiol
MVHNLGMLNWSQPESTYDWATEIDETFKKFILEGNHSPLINYQQLGHAAHLAIPTPEHFLPLLYTLGLQEKNDAINLFNTKTLMGSVSMTSVRIG